MTTTILGETLYLACVCPEMFQMGGGLGVLDVTTTIIANIQDLEFIKLPVSRTPSLTGKLLRSYGNDLKLFHVDNIRRNEGCKVCSPKVLK
jgi:hypothetical protein